MKTIVTEQTNTHLFVIVPSYHLFVLVIMKQTGRGLNHFLFCKRSQDIRMRNSGLQD